MTIPDTVQERISRLKERLEKCKKKMERLLDAEDEDRFERVRDESFLKIFTDSCTLVRDTEIDSAPYLPELLKIIQALHDDALAYAYSSPVMFDYVPSWAHDDEHGRPLVKDKFGVELPRIGESGRMRLIPWKQELQRHPQSSRLSRFRLALLPLSATRANPLAMSIFDARCEVSSQCVVEPVDLAISNDGSVLAMTGMFGYKHRDPGLEYFFLERPDDEYSKFPDEHFEGLGLASIPTHLAVDGTHRPIFAADGYRVKSYSWRALDGSTRNDLHPTHTLDSTTSGGPIAILPNGTMIRAGQGRADSWTIDELPTHGTTGKRIIGNKIKPEKIERSSGSLPTTHIQFVDEPLMAPSVWGPLANSPSTFVCAEWTRKPRHYSCVTIDLETGHTRARYLGHGAHVTRISTNPGDPQVFLTACNDGYARMYDTRQSLPVLTLDACGGAAECEAALLVHADGIPMVFSGSTQQEQIRLFDIRARCCVYELSTGNNAVRSLAWNSTRNALYAATECSHKDWMGFRHNYGPSMTAEILNRPGNNDEGDYEHCWPDRAFHVEHHFGYLFDAGDHRIYRYAFKENPDVSVLPAYGDARPGEAGPDGDCVVV
ncbi:hypothetical protein RSOLAG22IIIB_13238 [Rhizoctonia solani]|uniref:Uncharacterized protein n=1 Tax=Rhizoctonia solani TaxID=456999 RepID=A0A0K6GJE1_9AGAM|nr:hypothetical protein RSOLAG22IIIB_13238 [Rhizoctonia solani]